MVSSALRVAQERLLALREQRSDQRLTGCKWSARPISSDPALARQESSPNRRSRLFALEIIQDQAVEHAPPYSPHPSVFIHSEMAMAVLREGSVGPARLWWLLRHRDDGTGRLTRDTVKAQFAGRIGGWRRIRQLLCEGDGLFWRWDGKCVWLRSLTKVAAELGITRFATEPVALSIEKLLGRIAQVKAHLYAIFHISRDATPISRATLRDISSISASGQRNYEAATGIRPESQFALLPQSTEEAAWQHGSAAFSFIDHLGKHGKRGQRWTARQLPNSYSAPAKKQNHKRRKRRLNRKLADLSNLGTTGNGWRKIEPVYGVSGQASQASYFRGADRFWYVGLSADDGRPTWS